MQHERGNYIWIGGWGGGGGQVLRVHICGDYMYKTRGEREARRAERERSEG